MPRLPVVQDYWEGPFLWEFYLRDHTDAGFASM